MGLYDYESELYPVLPELQDFNWGKAMLLRSPVEDLNKAYDRLVGKLQELRDNEPPKKRGQKATYRSWVMQTHDLRDLLNEIAEELRSREKA